MIAPPQTASEAFALRELAIEFTIAHLCNHTPANVELIVELSEAAANFFENDDRAFRAIMFRQAGETALAFKRYDKAKEMFIKGLASDYVHPQDKAIMEKGLIEIEKKSKNG